MACLIVVLFCGALPTARPFIETKKKHTLKILSYNIHHAAPPSTEGAIDLDAISNVIKAQDPDLVALQEVDVFTARSGQYNQAEEIGKRTGLTPYFFKAIDFDGGEYGIAILSRTPAIETNHYPLPSKEGSGAEHRVLGTVTIRLSNRQEIIFACTHLDAQPDSANRRLQINAIVNLLKDAAHPVILAGDFNARPGSGVMTTLDKHFTRTCDHCGFTSPATDPKRAIDFVTYTPAGMFVVKRHEVIHEPYASDHLPVFAILETR